MKSFYEIDSYDFTRQQSDKIESEIEKKGKDYILRVDEEEFIKFLIDKYALIPISLEFESETITEPIVSTEFVEDRVFREKYKTEVYTFTVIHKFSGTPILFRVKPSTWHMTFTDISVNEYYSTVSYSFKLYKKNPEEFSRTKNDYHSRAFSNIRNINELVTNWNNGLEGLIKSFFLQLKNKFLQENSFFTAINVKVNKDTTSLFTAPTILKKQVPVPTISKDKEFSSEPMMANEMYSNVLKVIYDLGKSMERKPSTYKDKDEEGLRDQFLLVLETRYESATATGETFNREGKTDIILKYANDGSNLFVAECKIWHGASEFQNAIYQLFDRYLTWRDSKTALLIFATNKDFTKLLQTIKSETKLHHYFVKEAGSRGETSFSYIFHLPNDSEKMVLLEIIVFHFDL